MSETSYQHKFVRQPIRIGTFLELFNPRPVKLGGALKGDPFYQARWIFEPDSQDLKELKQHGAMILKFLKSDVDFKTLRPNRDYGWPFKTGDAVIADLTSKMTKADRKYKGGEDYLKGKIILSTKAYADKPPQLAVWRNGGWVDLETEEARKVNKVAFFPGMMAFGSVTLAGYEISSNNWGVTCYLNGVAATGKGDRLGGNVIVASETYPSLVTEGGNVVPFGKEGNDFFDDEIPF